MKSFCGFLFLFSTIIDIIPARDLFTERFVWEDYIYSGAQQDSDYFIRFRKILLWKNKLFGSIFESNYNGTEFSRLVYTDIDTPEKSPSLKPYPIHEPHRIRSVNNLEADRCDRLWLFDYLTQAITIIDLNQNKIIRQVKIKPTYALEKAVRISVDVDESDCQNAYVYIPYWSSLEILVYSFEYDTYWKTGKFAFDNEEFKNENFTEIQSVGIYPIRTPVNEKNNRALFLKPDNSEYLLATSTLSLRASGSSVSFQNFTVSDDRTPWLDKWYDEKNSIVLFPTYTRKSPWHMQAFIGCWNVKRFRKWSANTIHITPLPEVFANYIVIEFAEMDDQNNLWIVSHSCAIREVCLYRLYIVNVNEFVKDTVCDTI